MKIAKNTAARPRPTQALAIFCLMGALLSAGCSVLPKPPARADLYDFGPGLTVLPAASAQALPPLALAEVQTLSQPEGSSALMYRLAYANDQQLQPYSQARWSQPPAALMQQALRARLGTQRTVVSGEDSMALLAAPGRLPAVLRVQLEEFSQVFSAPAQSQALVRMRALVADAGPSGETLVAQRLFVVQRPAATPDAAGGARALADAAAQAADELALWLASLDR